MQTQTRRLNDLANHLPSVRRGLNGQIDWADWTGELIDAMQDHGATTAEIFEVFLWEAQVIVDLFSDCVPRERLFRAITEFSAVCAELVTAPPGCKPEMN